MCFVLGVIQAKKQFSKSDMNTHSFLLNDEHRLGALKANKKNIFLK